MSLQALGSSALYPFITLFKGKKETLGMAAKLRNDLCQIRARTQLHKTQHTSHRQNAVKEKMAR